MYTTAMEAIIPLGDEYSPIINENSIAIYRVDELPSNPPLTDIYSRQLPSDETASYDVIQPDTVYAGPFIADKKTGIIRRKLDAAKHITSAFRQDWQESENKRNVAIAFGKYLGVKAVGRFQLASMFVSYPAMEVCQNTHSAPLTALTAWLFSSAWSKVATCAMNGAVDQTSEDFYSCWRATGY